jgi:hypothetical protein
MFSIVAIYVIIEVAAIIFIVGSLVFWDKRYRKNHGAIIPAGFEKTEEVNIDPRSGKKLRVYYNPNTGERFYHEENNENK